MSTLERDAVNKWCPFTRGGWAKPLEGGGWQMDSDRIGFNRIFVRPGTEEREIGNCIGSSCMAWRTTGSKLISSDVEMVGLTGTRIRNNVERVGCCGLAGRAGFSDEELAASAPNRQEPA